MLVLHSGEVTGNLTLDAIFGARGYVTCAEEILDQAPDVRHVVVGVGSGGTMAGLVTGLGAERVLGVDTGSSAPWAILPAT